MALHSTSHGHAQRHGLTLLETLLATAILLIVVTAVMSALSAGRAQSNHAKQVVSATLAAEMLMARVTAGQSEAFLTGTAWTAHFTHDIQAGGWNGHAEQPGQIRAGREAALPLLPAGYQNLTLQVTTTHMTQLIPPPVATAIDGVEISVAASTPENRKMTRLVRFLPMPQTLAGASP
jgi:type II secretory pathway pseudopilin PulG